MTEEVEHYWVEQTDERVEGAKRQRAPIKVCWTCPCCDTEGSNSYNDDYFSYPIFGEWDEVWFSCNECGEDFILEGKVDITLTLRAQE